MTTNSNFGKITINGKEINPVSNIDFEIQEINNLKAFTDLKSATISCNISDSEDSEYEEKRILACGTDRRTRRPECR